MENFDINCYRCCECEAIFETCILDDDCLSCFNCDSNNVEVADDFFDKKNSFCGGGGCESCSGCS